MRTITRAQFNGTTEELQQRITVFKSACAAHAAIVGVPAPREVELVEELERTGDLFEVEPIPPEPIPPTAAELEAAAAEVLRLQNIRGDVLTTDLLDKLRAATPVQISNYVDASVTDLASARTMFKRILLILALR